MDTTTTTDSNPPRHAIESDSEEDEFNPLQRANKPAQSQDLKCDIQFLGSIQARDTLILATGDPGSFWAKGANLGEQTGSVHVNGVQIGLVFNPEWTKANVMISEALSRLPVWAMHPYAQAVINTLQPTTVALLDEYPVPSYISNKPVSLPDAPIRYLSTKPTFDLGNDAQPFAPPNLINTASASFLSLLSLHDNPSILLLLPSPNIPKPAPRTIEPSNFAHLTQDVMEWPTHIMVQAHRLLLQVVGESVAHDWESQDSTAGLRKRTAALRRSEVGEGGMYI